MWSSLESDTVVAEAECPDRACLFSRNVQSTAPSHAIECAGVTDDWVREARRCNNCGCVYTGLDARAIIRGYFYPTLGIWLPRN